MRLAALLAVAAGCVFPHDPVIARYEACMASYDKELAARGDDPDGKGHDPDGKAIAARSEACMKRARDGEGDD